jgi:hypothetical protein
MRKRDELSNPSCCFNRAGADEFVFVLLARDTAAPATIRAWIRERLRQRKNAAEDDQIMNAMECAARMERQRIRMRVGMRP